MAKSTLSVDLTNLSFEKVEVPPVVVRTTVVNPFAEPIKALAESMGDGDESNGAISLVVPTSDAIALTRLAQVAGKAHNVTVRKRVEEVSKTQVRLTFWTVPRITRSAPAK